jgi:hypothetical protein
MFGRGNWAVFGVTPSQVADFRKNLGSLGDNNFDFIKLIQSRAIAETKKTEEPQVGINPFDAPRSDEDHKKTPWCIEDFALTKDNPSEFGMWVVFNDYDDVSDPASKKEALAYKSANKPFKFLSKEEKLTVETQVKADAVISRKQIPVLVDFRDGRAYAATTNKDEILEVQALLDKLGAQTFPMAWQFDKADWPQRFLTHITSESFFTDEMAERAKELQEVGPDGVAKMEDKNMEKIVSTFCAITELDTGMWGGITTPVQIRLFEHLNPISVAEPSTAFTLWNSDAFEATVSAGVVIFQSLENKPTKKDEDRQVRTDVLTMDVNDGLNNLDAGAALLKGFDIPQFKKTIKTAIKTGDPLNIIDYWRLWLDGMRGGVYTFVDNINETLRLDSKKYGLREFKPEAKVEEVEVEA